MKYMLLVYHNEQDFSALGDTTHAAMLEESIRLAHEIASRRQYLAAPLQPTSTATCVRVRNSKPVVTDGPYAETHEQLAGYFLVEATNLDEAIGIAERVPGARIGTIEIRPIEMSPAYPWPRRGIPYHSEENASPPRPFARCQHPIASV